MTKHSNIDKLHSLKLIGMVEALEESMATDFSGPMIDPAGLSMLLDRELVYQETKRYHTRVRTAKLRNSTACPEEVDYSARRGLDKHNFTYLLQNHWIEGKHNLIITGPSGIGKTWLACSLANAACRQGLTTVFKHLPRLYGELEKSRDEGNYLRYLRKLVKPRLLILDDWGPERLVGNQCRDLLQILDERMDTGSTLMTSQLPVDTWYELINEPTFSDSILDRITSNSYRLELHGESLRKKISFPKLSTRTKKE